MRGSARIYDVRMAQFVLKIEKLSHIIGARGSQGLRSPSPIMAPDFHRLHHNALNTRDSGKTAKLPKVRLDFARLNFYFLGASIFYLLPSSLRNINSRVLLRKTLDDYYL